MVKISDLKPGMKVKLVDQLPPDYGWLGVSDLHHWLGKVVTIREVCYDLLAPYFLIEEDRMIAGGYGWIWTPKSIDCIVSDGKQFSDPEFSPAPDDAFFFLLSAEKEESHG